VHQALTPAAILILGLVIYTGFILPTRDMQGWLRWINYANPIAYAYESLVVNEFTDRQFSCLQFVPAYPDASPENRACAVPGAAPGEDFIDGDFYIGANYGYTRAHLWRNFGILCAFIVIYSITYVLAAEYIKTHRSKGEVLVFGRKTVAAQDAPKNEVKRETRVGEKTERSAVVPLTDNVFHWQDVCYEVSVKGETRRILDHVDGWVKPGTLTALMVSISFLGLRQANLHFRDRLEPARPPSSTSLQIASPPASSLATCSSTESREAPPSSVRRATSSSRTFICRLPPSERPCASAPNFDSLPPCQRPRSMPLSRR
jgi:CDR ABC transporter/ABC-2 family transporter